MTCDYLAIPRPTASWLLSRSHLVPQLAKDLEALSALAGLEKGVISVGQTRITASKTRRVVAMWNLDYLQGTGSEQWGFIRLASPYGVLDKPDILLEVLTRELSIVDRRLRHLLLDTAWQLRSELPPVTTCIAGRGKAWDAHRIAFVEGSGRFENALVKGVLALGPAWEDAPFREAAARQAPALPALLSEANALLSEAMRRPSLEHSFTWPEVARLDDTDIATQVPSTPVSVPPLDERSKTSYDTLSWRYSDWLRQPGRLTSTQTTIVTSSLVYHQPIRIVGAAGSGKTLTLMLLALHIIASSAAMKDSPRPRILYIAHNTAMRDKVLERFVGLQSDSAIADLERDIHVVTLFDYAMKELGVSEVLLVDQDAEASKRFQRDIVREQVSSVFRNHRDDVDSSALFSQVQDDGPLFNLFVQLLVDEIAVAIKGQGLSVSSDSALYVSSERGLSRLHEMMSGSERLIVWEIFCAYQDTIATDYGILDSDDLAISLLGRMRTPLWELRRGVAGYDYVFVDEAQLFNENERVLFPLMAKKAHHVPIVLALDQAQQTRSLSSAGIAALGVEGVNNQTLSSVHRCSVPILRLAFFVLQRSTDLFNSQFPDFTSSTVSTSSTSVTPELRDTKMSVASAAMDLVKALRQRNRRQICVVCFAERYWNSLRDDLQNLSGPKRIMEARGEMLPTGDAPLVVLARPDAVGGQEFDAVVCIGLERGVHPPQVASNQALSAALEQQALREMYLVFTRARAEVVVLIDAHGQPNDVVREAAKAGFLVDLTAEKST